MSQLIAPEKTVADGILLWRRIRELMKEKGSSYSLSAVAGRLGMSRETLRLMLNGERDIYLFELEKIAEDLKMPVARIMQEDIADLYSEIKRRKLSLQQLDEALELAQQRCTLAQGLSEKANALLDIGYLHVYLEQLDDAEQVYKDAYQIILQIGLSPTETELMYRAQHHIVMIHVFTKRYSTALELLESYKSVFLSNRLYHADFLNIKALIKQGLNELAEAKELMYQMIEIVRGQGRAEWLGRALTNVAYMEYSDLNYGRAKELLHQALEHMQTDPMRLLATKDLVKVHLKLHDHQAAEALIRDTLRWEAIKSNREMEARLLILLSRAKGVPHHAEAVAGNSKYPKNIRFLAGRFLRIFYRRWFMRGRSRRVKAVYKMPPRSFPYDKYF